MMNEPISWFSIQVLLGFLVGLYMLPGIIALARHQHQSFTIVVLNVVAGWTRDRLGRSTGLVSHRYERHRKRCVVTQRAAYQCKNRGSDTGSVSAAYNHS